MRRWGGLVAWVLTSACASGGSGPHTSLAPAGRPRELVVLMENMTDLALEWEFFDSLSDSIAAGIVTAKTASWCEKIPVPPAAQTARLFNGLQDVGLNPTQRPYWTLKLAGVGAFVPEQKPPC
jgi:hypothetical protein